MNKHPQQSMCGENAAGFGIASLLAIAELNA
jgi:hypothetical protein